MYYLIKKGDNLYTIAKNHQLSVEEIMNINPYLNPYNLIVGTNIKLPGSHQKDISHLKEKMREVWEQHVFWTRLLIVSIVEHLKDEPETTKRLLRNAKDLGALYHNIFGPEVTETVTNLITEHLVIGSKLIHAINDNNTEEAKKINLDWYANANDIAEGLSSVTAHYNKDELRKMFYKHLDLTKEEVMHRINHDYQKEIDVFDEIEKEALQMADALTAGINGE